MIAVLLTYLPLLLLSLAAEVAVVAVLAKSRRREAIRACIALNLCTHPLATAIGWHLPSENVIAIELIVFACEWCGYSHLLRRSLLRSLALALLANAASLLTGFAIWAARM